jgi:hypothetical protein
MLKSAEGGQLARIAGQLPVAQAAESCCADCVDQGCHWCVCHSLAVEGVGAVWLEPLRGERVGRARLVSTLWPRVIPESYCPKHRP